MQEYQNSFISDTIILKKNRFLKKFIIIYRNTLLTGKSKQWTERGIESRSESCALPMENSSSDP